MGATETRTGGMHQTLHNAVKSEQLGFALAATDIDKSVKVVQPL